MARKRMLDPDFFLDEELSTIPFEARLLYQGIWGICDDNYATLPNNPKWIKLQIFPYDNNVDIEKCLRDLENISKIVRFLHEGKEFWYVKNFFKYQVVNRPSHPKYPEFKRTKAVGIGLFSPTEINKLSTLSEGSLSTHNEVKEVREVKEEFSLKREEGKTGENFFNQKRGEINKKFTKR